MPIHFQKHSIKDDNTNPMQELADIYQEAERDIRPARAKKDGDDEMHFKNLIDDARRIRRRKILFAAALLLAAFAGASAAGFFYFGASRSFAYENLKLEVSGPDKVKINESFAYTISYQNLGVDLLNSRLAVRFPEKFSFESSDPASTSRNTWPLGDLTTYAAGKVKIFGHIVDNLENEQKLTATLAFQPANFNSDFSKDAAFSIALEAPDMKLSADFPPNVTPGQRFSAKFAFQNNDNVDFSNLKAVITYPTDFTYQSAIPAPAENNNFWIVPAVKADAKSDAISFFGSFPADLNFANGSDRDREFGVQLLLSNGGSEYFPIKEDKFTIKILDQAVTNALTINGQNADIRAGFGDTLTFAVSTRNNSKDAYSNASVKAIFVSNNSLALLDWSKIADDQGGRITSTPDGKEIVWTKAQIPSLAKFKPGDAVAVKFSIPIKSGSKAAALNQDLLPSAGLNLSAQTILPNVTQPIQSSGIHLTLTVPPAAPKK
ncbi:MAG: hypothetical protein V1928_04010 [Parcubacteria group bacterium]